MSTEQEWIDVEEPSLTTDEVTEVQDTVDQLGELESQVETTDDIAALEAYNYAFGLIKHYNQLGSSNGVSLESYGNHKSKKQHLVTGIRNQKELVKKHLTVALEAYVKNAPSEVAKAVDKYNKAVDALEKVDKNLTAGLPKMVNMNNMHVWEMMHIDNQLEKDGTIALVNEKASIQDIVDTLSSAIKEVSRSTEEKQSDGVIKKLMKKHFSGVDTKCELMFNRFVDVKNGVIVIDSHPVNPPKKETGNDKSYILATSGKFGTFAVLPHTKESMSKLSGYLMGKDELTTEKDLTKLHSVIKEVLDMDNYVDELCKIINSLTKNDSLPKEFKVNVITSCNKLINHITEVTHGIGVVIGFLGIKK